MARLWDSGTGHLLLTMPGRFESSVETQPAVLSRDGTLLGVERSGTTLRLWRLADGRELRTIRRAGADPAETLLGPVLDAEGRILAAASNRGMGFYDLDSGNELAFVRFENENLMCPRRFDRSTGWLTSGNRSAILWPTRWDAADSTLHVGPPRLRTSATDTGMDSSLDGRIQAFPQGNRTRVLDRDRPGWFFDLGPQQDVRHCAVSPDGRWIATCTWHPNPTVLAPCVRLWEIQGDGGRYVKDLPIDALATASFSPNGRWLVTHSSRGSQLWEVGTWRPLRQFKTNACWSADGQLLATHDRTGEIVFVEPESGSTVLRLIGPQEGHYFAAGMTPDGTRLISSVGDGTTGLRVWDLRLIREQLRELGMDWDLPEFDPKRVRPTPVRPVAVQLDPGIFRQPLFDDPRQAVGALSLLIDLQPFNAEWYFQRGLACGRLNQSASAVADYEMFLSLTPSSEPRRAEVHFRRASNYMENLKDDRKAMAALLDAADAPPERMPWPEQYASRCNHYAWQAVKPSSLTSSPEIVLRLARSAVKYEPHNFMYQNTLGVAQYRSGHHAEAVRCLQANLDRSREFIAFDLYVLAMSYHRLGDSAQARDCFDRANAAVAAGKSLSAGHRQELAAFRAEAEGVLGMKLQP
jgi:WD40 repeat protein